jgi:hypothetical protein
MARRTVSRGIRSWEISRPWEARTAAARRAAQLFSHTITSADESASS